MKVTPYFDFVPSLGHYECSIVQSPGKHACAGDICSHIIFDTGTVWPMFQLHQAVAGMLELTLLENLSFM